MKRLLTMAIAVCLAAGFVSAQDKGLDKVAKKAGRPSPEEIMAKKAARFAAELGLDDATTAKFVETYKAYSSDVFKAMKCDNCPKNHGAEMTDAEVEAKIQADFARSRKLLDVREQYYSIFRTFLNPRLIQKMYNLERRDGERVKAEQHNRQGGFRRGGGHGQAATHGAHGGGHHTRQAAGQADKE